VRARTLGSRAPLVDLSEGPPARAARRRSRTDDEVLSLPTYTTTSFRSFRLSKSVVADRLGIVTKNRPPVDSQESRATQAPDAPAGAQVSRANALPPDQDLGSVRFCLRPEQAEEH
jgi:hypothetical protein